MRCLEIFSVSCVVSCLVLVGIVGGKPAVSDAADPAVVLQSGLAVYPGPTESRAPIKTLTLGEEVLTRVEIIDSLGTGWCDVLSRGDETMIGYVRCEGLKVLRPDMPENWHVIPSPNEGKPHGTETKKSPASPTGSDSKAGATGQPVKTRVPESVPQ